MMATDLLCGQWTEESTKVESEGKKGAAVVQDSLSDGGTGDVSTCCIVARTTCKLLVLMEFMVPGDSGNTLRITWQSVTLRHGN